MSFVGGQLKLKGGETLQGVKKKKKSKAKEDAEKAVVAAIEEKADDKPSKEELKKILHGTELTAPGENEDRRTEAEKRFEAKQLKLEEDRLKKLASKSHRDRIKDFNDYLANLSVGLAFYWGFPWGSCPSCTCANVVPAQHVCVAASDVSGRAGVHLCMPPVNCVCVCACA